MSKIIQSDERPWGKFEVISQSVINTPQSGEKDLVIKKIFVLPKKRLSLQSHKFRDENWLVVYGSGIASVAENDKEISSGSFIKVPQLTKHRISNTGDTEMLIIEISTGNFDENDITRSEDDFGRI